MKNIRNDKIYESLNMNFRKSKNIKYGIIFPINYGLGNKVDSVVLKIKQIIIRMRNERI